MKKIDIIERLKKAGADERHELAQRLFSVLQNRLATGDMTVEFLELVLQDVVEDYEIDIEEKAL